MSSVAHGVSLAEAGFQSRIEKTYYHTTEQKMIGNALASYYIKDGILIPK